MQYKSVKGTKIKYRCEIPVNRIGKHDAVCLVKFAHYQFMGYENILVSLTFPNIHDFGQ